MRPGPVALAALLVSVCAGGAGGSPLLPSIVGSALQSKADIETVGWRYRHMRGYFRGSRRSNDVDRDVADSLSSRSNADIETTQWRRHRRDYGRNGRLDASAVRDETDASGVALTGPTASAAGWPDRRRRGRWVDPPPAR